MHDIDSPVPKLALSERSAIQQDLARDTPLASCFASQRVQLQTTVICVMHGGRLLAGGLQITVSTSTRHTRRAAQEGHGRVRGSDRRRQNIPESSCLHESDENWSETC